MTAAKATLEKLARGLRELADPPIVQLGPPRSGTTLVWNALCELFPNRLVHKRHALSRWRTAMVGLSPMVCTVRHPLDALASHVLRTDGPLTPVVFEGYVSALEVALREILRFRSRRRVVVLRYERFSRDLDGLVDDIGAFFKIGFGDVERRAVRRRCNLEEAERQARRYSTFAEMDPVTQIHGRHISAYRGASGYYRGVLTDEQLAIAAARLGSIQERLGYRD